MGKCWTFAAYAVLVAGSALAQAQSAYAPPPRTVEDILAVLDQYKPDPTAAQKMRDALDRPPPATGKENELAQYYRDRAVAAANIGLVSKRIADMRLALQHVAKGSPDEFMVLHELSLAEGAGGNMVNALRLREQSVNVIGVAKGRVLIGYIGAVNLSAALGDIAYAKKALARANETFGELQNVPAMRWYRHVWTGNIELGRATVLAAEGKLAEAEPGFRKALREIDEDFPMNRQRIAARMTALPQELFETIRDNVYGRALAENLTQQGKFTEAELVAREILQLSLQRGGRYSSDTGSALITLARIVFERGRYADTTALATAAIDIYQRVGASAESVFVAEARRGLGRALVALSKWQEAGKVFEDMQAGLMVDPLLAQKYGTGDIDWGVVLVRTGEAPRAAMMLEDMLKRYVERLGNADVQTAEVRGHLAIALAAQGQRERALNEFRQALPVLLDQARADRASESGGIARATRLMRVLEAYIALLADLHQAGVQGIDAVGETFRLADIARGGNVQRALAASAARSAISDPKLADLARQEQDTQQRLGILTDLLSRLLAAPSDQQLPKIIGDIRNEIDRLRANRAELKLEIEQRFPDYVNLIDPKPPTLEQARSALREGEALISIYVGADRTYVWAIPKQGAPAFAVVPLGEKEVARLVAELRKALDVSDASITQFPKYDVSAAYKLYSELLAPVESGWKDATSLLVVPHRALRELPFSVLVTAPTQVLSDSDVRFGGYRQVPWLIRKAAITQLTSVNALVTLRAMFQHSNERQAFVGFGDPYFSKDQQALADKQGLTQVPMLTRGVALRNLTIGKVALPVPGIPGVEQPSAALRNVPVVANSSTLSQLARLPDTADEIREIAQALKADPASDVFLGVAANEKNVKTVDLSNRKVIVFATHGLVPGDLNGLEQPALALTAPEVAGIDGDGLLTMDEILGLKFNADWVVLSACNTASGEGEGAEALSGLGRAFFYAGARALLVSNWPVETRSARLLTTGLFKRQSENPNLTRAEALRQTMLGLMDGQGQLDATGKLQFSYAHPAFWAPFSLVGDGGR